MYDETFAKQLSELSDFALTISGTKNDYSKEDMFNASLVFFEVFTSLMHDHHKDKLTQEQLEILSEEAGKSIHQTVEIFTGIDLKGIY